MAEPIRVTGMEFFLVLFGFVIGYFVGTRLGQQSFGADDEGAAPISFDQG